MSLVPVEFISESDTLESTPKSVESEESNLRYLKESKESMRATKEALAHQEHLSYGEVSSLLADSTLRLAVYLDKVGTARMERNSAENMGATLLERAAQFTELASSLEKDTFRTREDALAALKYLTTMKNSMIAEGLDTRRLIAFIARLDTRFINPVPYDQSAWAESSREHLPKVTAEMQIVPVLKRLEVVTPPEKQVTEFDKLSPEQRLDKLILWINNVRKSGKVLDAEDMQVIAGSIEDAEEVQHRISGIVGYRHIDYESSKRNDKHPPYIAAKDNLENNLKTLLHALEVLYPPRNYPDGVNKAILLSKVTLN